MSEERKTFRVVVGDEPHRIKRVCVDVTLRGDREMIEAFQALYLDKFLIIEFPADIVDPGTYREQEDHKYVGKNS